MARGHKGGAGNINYYPINETAARRAKEMNSFYDYQEGSAITEYRNLVDKAAAVAEKQKARVDPMFHEKIDHLLDTYARKLADNMNQQFTIDARVPSVMIAGPATATWRNGGIFRASSIKSAAPVWAESAQMTRRPSRN